MLLADLLVIRAQWRELAYISLSDRWELQEEHLATLQSGHQDNKEIQS
jgi:hypothetical protein